MRASKNSIFKFKQFEIDQAGCAMKINTDGVLLAALAECESPEQILDIGTGTGVIALMLAQRFNKAKIHSVEIDAAAAQTADRNFKSSVFSERLTSNHVSIEEFDSLQQFDLIVTNPPYFVNDLKNAEEKKGLARHTDEEFFDQLMDKVASLLRSTGRFWFILPPHQADLLIARGVAHKLKLNKEIHLHSDRSKPSFRKIVSLSRDAQPLITQHFYIYESEKVYTDAYKLLLKDFFLNY